MQRIIKVGLTFITSTIFLAVPAVAQEAVPPVIYNELQRQKFLDEALKSRDPATLTPEETQLLLLQSSQVGGLPEQGGVVEREWGYIFATGMSGSAGGAVNVGEYEITVTAPKGVLVTVPKRYIVSALSPEIEIGMQEKKGDGRVRYGVNPFFRIYDYFYNLSRKSAGKAFLWIDAVSDWLVSKFSPESQVSTDVAGVNSGPRLPFTVRLYNDQNGNGKKDASEPVVQWANVKINLIRNQRQTKEIQLTSGNNELSFSKAPLNIKNASDILFQATIVRPQDATLTISDSNDRSLSLVDGKIFGEDFEISRKTNYILQLQEPSMLTVVE